jgi:hypothetical protein
MCMYCDPGLVPHVCHPKSILIVASVYTRALDQLQDKDHHYRLSLCGRPRTAGMYVDHCSSVSAKAMR